MKKLIVSIYLFVVTLCLVGCKKIIPPSFNPPETMHNLFNDYGFEGVKLNGQKEHLIPMYTIFEEEFYPEFSNLKLNLQENSTDELEEYHRIYLVNNSVRENNYIGFYGQENQIVYSKVILNGSSYEVETNVYLFNKLIDYLFDFEFDYNTISDNDFLFIINNYKNSIYQSLYVLDGKKYGRLIASSNSVEDAVKVCTRHFTDERYENYINTVIDCNVIYESDILYGINVKWKVSSGSQHEENVISLKKSIADITVLNVIYNDIESYNICTNTEELLEEIMLYLYQNRNYLDIILDYETEDYTNEYIMNVYSYTVVGGDWGMRDTYFLKKSTIIIDKISGNVNFQAPIVLKTVQSDYRKTDLFI